MPVAAKLPTDELVFRHRTHVAQDLGLLVTLEMGKLYVESLGEVELSAQIFEYYAENAEAFLALTSRLGVEPCRGLVEQQQLGLVDDRLPDRKPLARILPKASLEDVAVPSTV